MLYNTYAPSYEIKLRYLGMGSAGYTLTTMTLVYLRYQKT